MAKKRKPASKAGSRRTSRRGKTAGAAADGAVADTSAATESSEPATIETEPTSTPSTAPSEHQPPLEPQTSETPAINPNLVPSVVLHKKFGKYRCLFNSDDTLARKIDVGSDSETNSSIEIRVVDPCASSESDSNAALDIHPDGNGGASPSLLQEDSGEGCSRDMSPVVMLVENTQIPLPADIPLPTESAPTADDNIALDLVPLPPPLEPEITENVEFASLDAAAVALQIDLSSIPEPEPISQHIPVDDDQTDYGEDDDDEEVITIVQILEDDNPDIYTINLDSPAEQTSNQEATESTENENRKQEEFQQHFQQLNIATSVESNVDSPMDCMEINNRTRLCGTPDLQLQKDHLDLTRPDPSLTPSSTFSDDSTSSRVAEQNQTNSNDSAESSPTGVRRSSRIKTISNMKQKTKGYGLVKTPLKKALITQTKLKLEEMGSDSQDKSNDMILNAIPNSPSFPVPSEMPVKVKSRWRRSSELEMVANSPASSPLASPSLPKLQPVNESSNPRDEDSFTVPLSKESYDKIIAERMQQYQHLDENEYMCERMISRDTKKMICDCFLTKEELERGELACGEDCLNRLLMIECNSRCPVGDRCTNRRFQKKKNAPLKVFYADKKGCGVEASVDIPAGEFLMEYIGEVLDYDQFYKRAQAYSDENNLHHYFMSLKGDTVIDATVKGNISRFINHSCDPNAETQKWTVNGELRIGFFSKRDIVAGEELTFDYQFQRFGKVAQRCYCGADACRGWIGAEPDSDDEDEEEEEEDVSTSKLLSESSEEALTAAGAAPPREKVRKPRRERKYKPKAKDLVQDADIEEDIEALTRTGVKNQSHTLRLSRTIVRAKTRRCQVALLRLLRDSDLPCRRLFLDYRGLRLLAPWCNEAPLDFRLEMLATVDRLPVPNKTLVQESRFISIVERWLSPTPVPDSDSFIDENTGLPVELPNRPPQDVSVEKSNAAMLEKVKDLSNQLLERWSTLKEVFKIPKKERIQQMKEHERQANVERRAADSSGARDRERREERDRRDERDREKDRERDRDRERERDRYRERERERDREREREREERDRRKRRSSPDGGRRSIRLSERVLAAVPPMSKEERRRAFAEAAAAAERGRDQQYRYWPEQFQMFPGGMMPPSMMVGMPGGMVAGMVPDEYQQQPYYQPYPAQAAMCMPQHNMSVMGMSSYGMGGFMFGQQLPAPFPAHPSQMTPQQMTQQQMTQQQMTQQLTQQQMTQQQMTQQQMTQQQITQQMQMAQQMQGMPQQMQMPCEQQIPDQPCVDPKDVVLPSLWRSTVDDRGRTYYYHVKLRQPQWRPPTPPPPLPDDGESSSEDEEDIPAVDELVRMPAKGKFVEGVNGIYEVVSKAHNGLIPEHALLTMRPRKRRPGLVTERPISPRTEEDKLAGRMEVKRYRQTKEKLRRRREKLLQRVRLLARDTLPQGEIKIDLADSDSDSAVSEEAVAAPLPPAPAPVPTPAPAPAPAPATPVDKEGVARKIKEQFRSAMARVMVQHLNPFRHSEARAGRITNTADFKHLARKLTHFVMLKELKHCRSVDELVVTDSVRSKAKMFVKKYMAKFGPVYRRPVEEQD